MWDKKKKAIGKTRKHAIIITFTFFRLEIELLLFPHTNNIGDEKDNINPGSQHQFHFRYGETWQTV